MINSVLEVGIGLTFVFLVFSLVVSGMHEGLARLLSWRAKALWAGIRQMVDGNAVKAGVGRLTRVMYVAQTDSDPRPDLAAADAARARAPADLPGHVAPAIYAHPLVAELDKLHTTSKSKVEQLPPNQFAQALIDVLVPDGNGETTVTRVRESVRGFPDESPLKQPMLLLVSEAGDSLETLRAKIGGWFDGQMARLSLRYRRRAKWWMLGFGFVVAVAFNLDAIAAADRLYRDDALRAAIVDQADTVTSQCKGKTGNELSSCIRDQASPADHAITLPVGWPNSGDRDLWLRALGWSATAFALMQGAPFWFDLLTRALSWRRGRADAAGP
jgi:hypothetical protein